MRQFMSNGKNDPLPREEWHDRAATHAELDRQAGRNWVCQCYVCTGVRKEIEKYTSPNKKGGKP
jgi:hypothetical protein